MVMENKVKVLQDGLVYDRSIGFISQYSKPFHTSMR